MPDNSSYVEQSEGELNAPVPSSRDSYEFMISIDSQGYTVDGESVATLSDVLKHVIAIAREHPQANDAHDQLSAGYGAENSL